MSTRSGHSRALPDHLVGAGEDQSRDRQAEHFCRSAVEDQIELGRLFNRQVGRFRTLQDLVYVGSGTPVQILVA
jgi:hypothetical protein